MITPMIASLSEDAMSSVPKVMKEGAYALGATKLEVAIKIVIPAAISGIVASIVLAISRAIGETMIVAVAGGSTPNLSFDVTSSIQTMTAYIVQVSQEMLDMARPSIIVSTQLDLHCLFSPCS